MLILLILHILVSGILNEIIHDELKLIVCIILILLNIFSFPSTECVLVSLLMMLDLNYDLNQLMYANEILWICMMISFFVLSYTQNFTLLILISIITNMPVRCKLYAVAILISGMLDELLL